jgi:NAD(P)-dependent dehydrogenase (short-subunit alcohol dehydrogenase family)
MSGMDLELAGKRAVVTGGSRGIGLAVAEGLAAEGVDVVLVARDAVALDIAAERVAAHGGRAIPIVADTRNDASVRAMIEAAVGALGGIDILVNSAASPASSGPTPSLADLTDDDVRLQFETKLLGYLRCARAVAPHMKAQGWGRIINISGLNARRAGSLVGSVRNVAVAAMTKNLADELGPSGINVTVVHPGVTVTQAMPARLQRLSGEQGISTDAVEAKLAAATSNNRLTTAAEVAAVVTFLASPRSIAINGDAIAAGGGERGAIHY